MLRWLQANRVDHILIGAVARAIRGDAGAEGAVAIVPAPYGRNLERLSRALESAHARVRIDGEADTMPIRMNADKLARGLRWTLRCGIHDIDIESRTAGVPRYQDLVYEAHSVELEPGLSVQVASPEDLEHFEFARGNWYEAPEIRITRVEQDG